MGVFGLLSHILESDCGNEVDLFKVASEKNGIELLIDFVGFNVQIQSHVSAYVRSKEPCWLAVNYLGGEYHIFNLLVLRFCKSLASHLITPVFFNDGPRGSDPLQDERKMETWILRNDDATNRCIGLSNYLQGLCGIDDIRMQIPLFTQEQAKSAIKKSISEYGGKFVTCKGEADDVMAKYLHDTPQAYAILGNDSDFCVMKNCRFIESRNFDWMVLFGGGEDTEDVQCNVTVYTTDGVQQCLGLQNHRELIDIAILLGNDFTKPLLGKMWKDRASLQLLDVVKWYTENIGINELEECPQFQNILSDTPDLKQAIDYSRKFYNFTDVDRKTQPVDGEICQLKKYLLESVNNNKISPAALAWYEAMAWGSSVVEDTQLPSIEDWCTGLCMFPISMCTQQQQVTLMSRTNLRQLDKRKIGVKNFDWLPKAHQVPYVDDESRWKLFNKIVGHMECSVDKATKEDIYNGTDLHSYFQRHNTRAGFLIHAVNYLMTVSFENKFQMETWEYVALLAMALYCVDKKEDKVRFKPTWIKPTMRCITLGSWYQFILKVIYRLARLLLISEDFPEPQHAYQGTYFTSLYMTVKEKGISQDYIDPKVLETLEHIVEENCVLDRATKDKMKKELVFIEGEMAAEDDNLSDDEDYEETVTPRNLGDPGRLPIESHKYDILDHLNKYRVICIQGRTGSGKSTKVPQFILEEYDEQRRLGIETEKPHIIVTQPRRIAAKSLAGRVAQEMGEAVGNRVGYKIGMDHTFCEKTEILYVTTGYMIELLVHNPGLFNRYSHVILDEIHERDLDADLMSLIVRLLMDTHTKPKIIVMSATLQADLFVMYFTQSKSTAAILDQQVNCDVKSIFKVQELYIEDLVEYYGRGLSQEAQIGILKLFGQFHGKSISEIANSTVAKNDKSYSNLALKQMRDLAAKLINNDALSSRDMTGKPKGHVMKAKNNQLYVQLIQSLAEPGESILMFLAGKQDIDDLYDLLAPYEGRPGVYSRPPAGWRCPITIFILHSSIPFEDQQECMSAPKSERCHVILSTNIAESSLTLPRVTVIIDSGLRRQQIYDMKRRVRSLQTGWASRASMMQRRGRTGRVCNGICVRMMTRQHYESRPPFDEPQMRVAPLDKLLLQVKHVGKRIRPGQKPSELLLQAVEPPAITNIDAAARSLSDIGAITAPDECADVTLLGQLIMKLPLDLNNCRIVFYGCLFGCPCDAVVMAAALASQDPFTQPSKKVLKSQDLFIEKICLSYHSRKAFDAGCYSEPVMFRNLYRTWLEKLIDFESPRFRSYSAYSSRLTKREQLKKEREAFCQNNSVIEDRWSTMENLVSDVANNTLNCLESTSENHHKLNEMVNIISSRGKRRVGHARMEERVLGSYPLKQLFSDDLLLLNMILAAALSPKFVIGSAANTGKKKSGKSSKSLDTLMKNAKVNPERTIAITKPKELLDKDDMLHDVVRNISLMRKRNRYLEHRGIGDSRGFKIASLADDDSKMLVEYSVPPDAAKRSTDRVNPKYQITSDVHHYLHYPYQFSEAPSRREFYMELPTDAARAYCGNSYIYVEMPESPFRIKWCIMSSEGESLKNRNRGCEAICGWRNPTGFSCDLNKMDHYGVTAKFTGRGNIGWADNIALFPVYQENLYAIFIMLAFMPQQHGVGFTVDTMEMVITEVVMFDYTMPVSKKYGITCKVLKFLNEMRAELSSKLISTNTSIHQIQIPDSKLRQIYLRFLKYLESNDDETKSEHQRMCKQHSGVLGNTNQYSGENHQNLKQEESHPFDGLEKTEGSNRLGTSTSSKVEVTAGNEDFENSEEEEKVNPFPDLPELITVNAFNASAEFIQQQKEEQNWRRTKVTTEMTEESNANGVAFEYLTPYDEKVFNREHLAEFHVKRKELLQVPAEESEDESGEDETDDDEEVILIDPEYISLYTYSQLNPARLRDNLKAKVIAHLSEKQVPTLVSRLIKDDSIGESISAITERSDDDSFDLLRFLLDNSRYFLVASLNMKKKVVCLRDSETGNVLSILIESDERNKVEKYVLTMMCCVLLAESNKPQEIATFLSELNNFKKKFEQKDKMEEVQQVLDLMGGDLATLIQEYDQVFDLQTSVDEIITVSFTKSVYRKIIKAKPKKTAVSIPQKKDEKKLAIEESQDIENEKEKNKTEMELKVNDLKLSTGQKACIKGHLFDHLIENDNVPVNFEDIIQISEICNIVQKSAESESSQVKVNWRKVLKTKRDSEQCFEITGSSVQLYETVFCKTQEAMGVELDLKDHKVSQDEPPDDWESNTNLSLSVDKSTQEVNKFYTWSNQETDEGDWALHHSSDDANTCIDSNKISPLANNNTVIMKSVVSPEAYVLKSGVPPEAYIEKSGVQPEANIEKSVVPPEANIEKSGVPPEANIEKRGVPPEANIEKSVVTPEANIEKSGVPPEANIEKSVVTPEANIEKSVVTPEANIEKSIVPPEANIEKSVVIPEANIEKSGVPPEANIEKSVVPPEANIEKSGVPPEANIEESGVTPEANIERSVVPPEANIEKSVVTPEVYLINMVSEAIIEKTIMANDPGMDTYIKDTPVTRTPYDCDSDTVTHSPPKSGYFWSDECSDETFTDGSLEGQMHGTIFGTIPKKSGKASSKRNSVIENDALNIAITGNTAESDADICKSEINDINNMGVEIINDKMTNNESAVNSNEKNARDMFEEETHKKSTAEVELRCEIMKLFQTTEKSELRLIDVQKPEVMEKWKEVKQQGKYIKFMDFIRDDLIFLAKRDDGVSEWTIECEKLECKISPICYHEKKGEKNEFHFKDVEPKELKDLAISIQQYLFVQPDQKYLVVNLPDCLNIRCALEKLRNVSLTKPRLLDIIKPLFDVYEDAKGGMIVCLSQEQKEEIELHNEILKVFQTAETSVLNLSAVHKGEVMDKWNQVKQTGKYSSFMKYIKEQHEYFLPEKCNGSWLITYKNCTWPTSKATNDSKSKPDADANSKKEIYTGIKKSEAEPSKIPSIQQLGSEAKPSKIPSVQTLGSDATPDVVQLSSAADVKKIGHGDNLTSAQSLEILFLDAAKEYLLRLPENKCLLLNLETTDENVKVAWENLKSNVKPVPRMKKVLAKYLDVFFIDDTNLNQEVVHLVQKRKQNTETLIKVTQTDSVSEIQQTQFNCTSTKERTENKQYELPKPMKSNVSSKSSMSANVLHAKDAERIGGVCRGEKLSSLFSDDPACKIERKLDSFCKSHNIRDIHTVINRHGEHFLCNAVLSDKTIGQGYGESEDVARYYAMCDALKWLKNVFN